METHQLPRSKAVISCTKHWNRALCQHLLLPGHSHKLCVSIGILIVLNSITKFRKFNTSFSRCEYVPSLSISYRVLPVHLALAMTEGIFIAILDITTSTTSPHKGKKRLQVLKKLLEFCLQSISYLQVGSHLSRATNEIVGKGNFTFYTKKDQHLNIFLPNFCSPTRLTELYLLKWNKVKYD